MCSAMLMEKPDGETIIVDLEEPVLVILSPCAFTKPFASSSLYASSIPDRSLSIYEGGIVPLGKYKNQMIFWQVEAILKKYDCTLKSPISDLPDDAIREVLYG